LGEWSKELREYGKNVDLHRPNSIADISTRRTDALQEVPTLVSPSPLVQGEGRFPTRLSPWRRKPKCIYGPVVAQYSCRITPFSFLLARTYRTETSLLTCRFSSIVSAMTLLLSLVVTQACQQHGFLLSFHNDWR
jgi:hypothetical protein